MKKQNTCFFKTTLSPVLGWIRFLWGIFLPAMMISCTLPTQPDSRIEADLNARTQVLVINSDPGVEKYRIVQDEFVGHILHPVQTIPAQTISDSRYPASMIKKLNPEIIYCIGTAAYLLASENTPEKPIVFSSVLNWMRLPVTHLTHGVASELHSGMQMMLFRYIFPDLKKIGILYSDRFNRQWIDTVVKTAGETGFEILERKLIRGSKPFADLLSILAQADAFWLISDPDLIPDTDTLIRFQREVALTESTASEAKFRYYAALIDLRKKEGILLNEYWDGVI